MTSPKQPPSGRETEVGGPAKPDPETLDGEIVSLRRDLWLFRTAYLPLLLRAAGSAAVERWQATARELADAIAAALPQAAASEGGAS